MGNWKNFADYELECKCGCGTLEKSRDFIEMMDTIQTIREELGFPFKVNSAYRCENHEVEKAKKTPGWHNRAAIDISTRGLTGNQKHDLLEELINYFCGVGVYPTFIHVDMRPGSQRTFWVGK